jgi:hypothetical protein
LSLVLSVLVFIAYSKIRGRKPQPLWLDEARTLVAGGLLYFPSLLLARFSSFVIVGFYLLSAQVPILVNAAFRSAAVGETQGSYEVEMLWTEICYDIRHKQSILAQNIASITASVVYLVLAGIVYFSATVPSTAETLSIIRLTLLIVFLVTSAIYIPTIVGISLSENLSSTARRRRLGISLAELVPTGMLLAILLWTFSSSTQAPVHAAPQFRLTYVPVTLFVLLAYFFITFLIPYLIGFTRGTRWNNELLERRTEALTETIRILRTPVVSFHGRELLALATKLQEEREKRMAADKCLRGLPLEITDAARVDPYAADWVRPGFYRRTSDSVDVNRQPPGEEIVSTESDEDIFADFELFGIDSDFYDRLRSLDPRFQYLDWLCSLAGRLQMTVSDLQAIPDPAAELSAAITWADNYDFDRGDLREKASRTRTNTIAVALGSTLVTSVVSVFFTSFASWLWAYVSQTLPQ